MAFSLLGAPEPNVPRPSQSRPTKPASSESLEPAGPDPGLSVQPGSGQSFRDRLANGQPCPTCPEMVVVPNGKLTMGSPESEPERDSDEDQVLVSIAKSFAVGKFAVTRGEFAAFIEETAYKTDNGCYTWSGTEWKQLDKSWRTPGFAQDDRNPVVCVNWNDAKAYAAWLSNKTGKTYRLLSEAEREYVTRAGTITPFWWGTQSHHCRRTTTETSRVCRARLEGRKSPTYSASRQLQSEPVGTLQCPRQCLGLD